MKAFLKFHGYFCPLLGVCLGYLVGVGWGAALMVSAIGRAVLMSSEGWAVVMWSAIGQRSAVRASEGVGIGCQWWAVGWSGGQVVGVVCPRCGGWGGVQGCAFAYLLHFLRGRGSTRFHSEAALSVLNLIPKNETWGCYADISAL